MTKTYAIRTFGCQMNHSDSERVASILEMSGFVVDEEDQADLLVVNTCSIRQKAEDKAYGFINNYKKQRPHSTVAVTGCVVRQTGDKNNSRDVLLRHEVIDLVFRIEDIARLPKLLEKHFLRHDFTDFATQFGAGSLENYFRVVPKVTNRTQVFVPIMQGCDKFCTFCIVPYTRGRESSRPLQDIWEECRIHVERGATEITLLGQNVNSYRDGPQGEKCFAKLLLKLDQLHDAGLSRLRFTSPHPQDFTPDVITALAKMKTSCPYVHLPMQHGSDEVLRRMNRNYTVEKYRSIVQDLRKAIPGVTIATDIIVGFPGETEEQFAQLCEVAREIKFDFSYTAIYSPRDNTPAGKMKNKFISRQEQKRRFHIFDDIIKETSWQRREQSLNQELSVLVEKVLAKPDGTFYHEGRSREFFEVHFSASQNYQHREVPVQIKTRHGYVLSGEARAMTSALPVI